MSFSYDSWYSCDVYFLFLDFPDKRPVRTRKELWFHSQIDRKVSHYVLKFIGESYVLEFKIER